MACAEPLPRVAVEVFVEKHKVAPVRIASVYLFTAVDRPYARRARKEEGDKPPRDLPSHFAEVPSGAAPGGKLDLERVPVKVVIPLERFDDEIVQRKPYRSPPIRVSPEKCGVGLSRDVGDAVRLASKGERVRVV